MRQVNEDRDPPTLNQALPTELVWSLGFRGEGRGSVEGMVLQVEDCNLFVLWLRCGSCHYEIGVPPNLEILVHSCFSVFGGFWPLHCSMFSLGSGLGGWCPDFRTEESGPF